ncbi:hypothetical protein E2C01_013686 [Portunus trituberculatus]|uniref:Uncharacterized protein n=1 Tax=Portunus trituberculatus TaxID=210409 RepID=A0A5B7DHB1_PORTR|nr:hypothetical protein [Portunus trituberculatus]
MKVTDQWEVLVVMTSHMAGEAPPMSRRTPGVVRWQGGCMVALGCRAVSSRPELRYRCGGDRTVDSLEVGWMRHERGVVFVNTQEEEEEVVVVVVECHALPLLSRSSLSPSKPLISLCFSFTFSADAPDSSDTSCSYLCILSLPYPFMILHPSRPPFYPSQLPVNFRDFTFILLNLYSTFTTSLHHLQLPLILHNIPPSFTTSPHLSQSFLTLHPSQPLLILRYKYFLGNVKNFTSATLPSSFLYSPLFFILPFIHSTLPSLP